MSGRSAIVRKEKTKVKDKDKDKDEPPNRMLDAEPNPYYVEPGGTQQFKLSSSRSNSSHGNDDLAVALARKLPVFDTGVSGIEKSDLRVALDKQSKKARKTIGSVFSTKKKKKNEEAQRSESAQTFRTGLSELPGNESYIMNSLPIRSPYQHGPAPDFSRKLPPITLPVAQSPILKRWAGAGQPPVPWKKLHKDGELWQQDTDTEIFFCLPSDNKPPSFVVSSHAIEATKSKYLINMLQLSSVSERSPNRHVSVSAGMPQMRAGFPLLTDRFQHSSQTGDRNYPVEASVNYQLYFPAPQDLSPHDALRHQITTRNFFALLQEAAIVGFNLFQALDDLRERLELWVPDNDRDGYGPIDRILSYIISRDLDDVRGNPSAAAALLSFYEHPSVRDAAAWRETFIHACGMCNEVSAAHTELASTSAMTKAMIEQAGGNMDMNVIKCAGALRAFDFEEIWAGPEGRPTSPEDSVARCAFNRLRKFFIDFYVRQYGSWPPALRNANSSQWLTRKIAQDMTKDFASLYDYYVDRESQWSCSVEHAGRKFHIVQGEQNVEADPEGFSFTDIVVEFDNREQYPHIPSPYPLLPEKTKGSQNSAHIKYGHGDPKLIEKQARLAYLQATNVYRLEQDFKHTALLTAFQEVEKTDSTGFKDPHEARKGRWALIYCVLQALASVSVDTPGMKRTNVEYFINPQIGRGPPWQGPVDQFPEAHHNLSHCWAVRNTWTARHPASVAGTEQDQRSERTQTSAQREEYTPRGVNEKFPERSRGEHYSERGARSYTESNVGSATWEHREGTSMRSPTLINASVRNSGGARQSNIDEQDQYSDRGEYDFRSQPNNQNKYAERGVSGLRNQPGHQYVSLPNIHTARQPTLYDPRSKQNLKDQSLNSEGYDQRNNDSRVPFTQQNIMSHNQYKAPSGSLPSLPDAHRARNMSQLSTRAEERPDHSIDSPSDMISRTGYTAGIEKVDQWSDRGRSYVDMPGESRDASISGEYHSSGSEYAQAREDQSEDHQRMSPRIWAGHSRLAVSPLKYGQQFPKPPGTFINDFDDPSLDGLTGRDWLEQ